MGDAKNKRGETTSRFPQRSRVEAVGNTADDQNEKGETLRFLVEQKVTFVNMAGNVCMTWWVSSVVFCATVLAAVWLNRKELAESGVIGWLGFVLLFFFATVVSYGFVIIKYLDKLQKEIASLTKELADREGLFSNELSTFKQAMMVGTSSFGLVLIVWIVIWIGLWQGFWNK